RPEDRQSDHDEHNHNDESRRNEQGNAQPLKAPLAPGRHLLACLLCRLELGPRRLPLGARRKTLLRSKVQTAARAERLGSGGLTARRANALLRLGHLWGILCRADATGYAVSARRKISETGTPKARAMRATASTDGLRSPRSIPPR